MPLGGGKYNDALEDVRERYKILEAILIVVEGARGPGFTAALSAEALANVPKILRDTADQIEAIYRSGEI